MRPFNLNNHTYYFSIIRFSRGENNKFRYDVRLDANDYVLVKSLNVKDCEQVDDKKKLNPELVEELCKIIADVESAYQLHPSIEYINSTLFTIISGIRNPLFKKRQFWELS